MCPSPRRFQSTSPLGAERPARHPRLRGARHTDLNARLCQLLVEISGTTFGVGALPIHDQPDRDALLGFRDQRSGKPIPNQTRTKTELIDVHGR